MLCKICTPPCFIAEKERQHIPIPIPTIFLEDNEAEENFKDILTDHQKVLEATESNTNLVKILTALNVFIILFCVTFSEN